MRIGFGLGRLHHLPRASAREQIVLGALYAGCTHFDLAPSYGDGLCEAEAGRLLRTKRNEITLATKFGIPVSDLGARSTYLYFARKVFGRLFSPRYGSEYAIRDFTPEAARGSLEASLRRLRTEWIDDFFLHDPRNLADLNALDELRDALERLRTEGKIRRWGISTGTALALQALAGGRRLGNALQFELSPESPMLAERAGPHVERFAFGIVRAFAGRPGQRIDIADALQKFRIALPGVTPLVATNRRGELPKLGRAISLLSGK